MFSKVGMYLPERDWYWLHSTHTTGGASFIDGTSYVKASLEGSGRYALGLRPMI